MSYAILGKKNPRGIAGIIPEVVVRELHNDDITITEHPVGQGAPITDHAYKNPETVMIEFGWSDSFLSLNSARISSAQSIFNGAQNLNDIYDSLLELQASLEPIDVGTGKRQYTNMLIKSLQVETDINTENLLMIKAVFQKIYIVQTETLSLQADVQQDPEDTASMTKGGERQLEQYVDEVTDIEKWM